MSILGLFISLVLASFFTDVIKNAVGRPRPDLIARCKPRKGTPKHELVTIDVCTEENHHKLHDGWRSFPSGHSSFAFGGLGYLALYGWMRFTTEHLLTTCSFLAGQMHIFRPRTDLARVLLALSPLIGAALIAISRCEDYRHDVYDVTVGSILGLLIAYFSYKRYYPGLISTHCDVPYPSRSETATLNGYSKIKDEEERISSVRAPAMNNLNEDSEHVPLQNPGTDRGRIHTARD